MPSLQRDWIVPDWPCPARVRALITTRAGGVSNGPYASLNLGEKVGDTPQNVRENRRRLALHLPAAPRWLNQMHGKVVVKADGIADSPQADAAFTSAANVVCAVMMADCLPVLLCDRNGCNVAATHAGWRGLCAGVIESTVGAMGVPPHELIAYLGPAIGPDAFEVGQDVYSSFVDQDAQAAAAFRPHQPDKWLADLFMLARQRLQCAGVNAIFGASLCTYTDATRFFSHRRDGISGRMAALIWRTN